MSNNHSFPHARRAFILLALGILLIISVSPAGFAAAQNTPSSPTPRTSLDGPLLSTSQLIARAQTTGSKVRVIVGLNTAFQPTGDLSPAAALAQENALAQSHRALAQSLLAYGAQVTAHSDQWHIPYMALEVNAAALTYLASSSQVTGIFEDRPMRPANNALSLSDMNVPNAWARGYDGTGYTVAIVDTGVESGHSFLGPNRVVREYCSSTTDTSGFYSPYGGEIYSICPDGQNNLEGNHTQEGTGAADPSACADPFLDIASECEHGTHVAGIAAGNDITNAVNDGVARGATIIGTQVFSDFVIGCKDQFGFLYDCALTYPSDQINALNYIYSQHNALKIASVNMSLGGGYYTSQATCDANYAPVKAVIDLLRSVNIATIIASGNSYFDSALSAPGCISSAIAVGSVSDNDAPGSLIKISYFANVSPMLDLLAPGESILSSVPGNSFASLSGTSMATPQVTGAWAVMRQAFPNANVTKILQTLQATGTPVLDSSRSHDVQGDPDGVCYNPFTGLPTTCSHATYKLINLDAAIASLLPDKPILTAPLDVAIVAPGPTVTWQAALHAASYEIQLNTTNTFTDTLPTPIAVSTTSYKPPFLANDVRYYWRVRAVNLGNFSAWSDVRTFALNGAPPLHFFTTGNPTLTWNAVTGAVRYQIQVSLNSTFTTTVIGDIFVNAPALSAVITGAPLPDNIYYWRVRACTGAASTTCGAYSTPDAFKVDAP